LRARKNLHAVFRRGSCARIYFFSSTTDKHHGNMGRKEIEMRKALVIALGLAGFGLFVQPASADTPSNCIKSEQRCRAQNVAPAICWSRFDFCERYNRKLGFNWSGAPLPVRIDSGKIRKATVSVSVTMNESPGAAPSAAATNSGVISTNGSALTNTGAVVKRRAVVTGGAAGPISAPGTAKAKFNANTSGK
jgi:hypothetical protein